MPKVFVVILNWNRAKDTIECLKSVTNLKVEDYNLYILVVDNGSDDNSVETIDKFKISKQNKPLKINIIKNEKNLGYAEGNNVGIDYALKNGANYILVLNNDTIVEDNLIPEFLSQIKKVNNLGILSPKIYFAPGYEYHKNKYKKNDLGKVIWSAGGKLNWNYVYGENVGVDEVDHGQYDKARSIDFASGACVFIKSEVLKKIGLFDPRFYTYFEDTDLCLRAQKVGYKIQYDPKAIVWHKVAQSSGIGSELNDYYITRNRLIFGIKYAPLKVKLALILESIRFIMWGRKWQKIAAIDFYLGNYGKGSWS